MLKHELDFVWITSDGKRFLDKAQATKHEETLHIEEEDIVTQWLNKLKGERKNED